MSMILQNIREISSRKYEVSADGESFVLSAGELYELGLPPVIPGEEPIELSDEKSREIYTLLRRKAVRRCGELLKNQDYTEKRLKEKLMGSGIPEQTAEEAVQEMILAHYVDDERFARTFIRSHMADRSRMRICQDLKNRGVDDSVLERAFSGILAEEGEESLRRGELEQCRKLLRSKHYDPSADWQEKQKILASLSRRGYPMDVIREAADDLSGNSRQQMPGSAK